MVARAASGVAEVAWRVAEPAGWPHRSRMCVLMDRIRVALAQLAPSLGELDRNLARHHEILEEARADKADLVVFPARGLTGYQLQDLAAEVSLRLDDPRLADLAA